MISSSEMEKLYDEARNYLLGGPRLRMTKNSLRMNRLVNEREMGREFHFGYNMTRAWMQWSLFS